MKSKVQTFRASSPHEALELVKRAMGPDAVILGTRSVAAPSLNPLAGRRWVEISAAPSETLSPAPRLRLAPGPPPAGSPAEPAPQAARRWPECLVPFHEQLLQNGVAPELASRLVMQAARELPQGKQTDTTTVANVLRRCIVEMMPRSHGVDSEPGSARRVALVGPSGSGKSTTLAKLAAHDKLRENGSVSLLSLDMQHLGAHDRLRRYAEILESPFCAAQTITEVKNCLRNTDPGEFLLIDTPGIGPRDNGLFARLAMLLRAARPTEVYVVLPASMDIEVLTRVAQGFSPLKPTGVVLTRLDEVVGPGAILNVVDHLHMTVSYVTTGPNVPDDLEKTCDQRVAELVLPAERSPGCTSSVVNQ